MPIDPVPGSLDALKIEREEIIEKMNSSDVSTQEKLECFERLKVVLAEMRPLLDESLQRSHENVKAAEDNLLQAFKNVGI